jgi:hypothetical protein
VREGVFFIAETPSLTVGLPPRIAVMLSVKITGDNA